MRRPGEAGGGVARDWAERHDGLRELDTKTESQDDGWVELRVHGPRYLRSNMSSRSVPGTVKLLPTSAPSPRSTRTY